MINVKRDTINNIIMAIYLSIPMVTKIIVSVIEIKNNILILIGILIFLTLLINKKMIKLERKFIVINVIVLILFLLSFLKIVDTDYTQYYLLNYMLYGFTGMFLLQFKYEYKEIFKYINLIFMIFTVLLIFKYIPQIKSSTNLDFVMDLSYSTLIGLIAAIIYLKYEQKPHIKALTIINILISILFLFIFNNNRGSILTLGIFIVILFIQKIKKRNNKLIVLVFLIALLITMYNNTILDYIINLNTNVNLINRMAFQIKQGDVTSGRNILYEDASKGISNNIILGNGIGHFEINHNGLYTHNLFLQLAYENGIFIATIIVVYIIICGYKTIFSEEKSEKYDFMIFLLVQFIPRLLISSVYWSNSYIWIYIYMNISKTKNTKQIE